MISYSDKQWLLFLLGASIGLGGGIWIVLRMCKRENISAWRLLTGMQKGSYISYYTLAEKLIFVVLGIVSLGIIVFATQYN